MIALCGFIANLATVKLYYYVKERVKWKGAYEQRRRH